MSKQMNFRKKSMKWTQERKDKMSATWKKHRHVVQCPSCGIVGAYPIMQRYHFDKCKRNKVSFLKKLYMRIWYKLSPL